MNILELIFINKNEIVSDSSRTLSQWKFGSLLFATMIVIRPNIAFAISQLSRFNLRLGPQYHEVANQVFHYLLSIQDHCIRYGGDVQNFTSFIYTSNVFFSNNTLN